MKVRDSGMPDEKTWSNFFNIELILSKLLINEQINTLVEIGCGYGTFTIPASYRIKGKLIAFDIEKEMINIVQEKIINLGIENIILMQKDIINDTTGLTINSIDYVMLLNILHHNRPDEIFEETYRILKPGGNAGIIHWRSDIQTPRGPDLTIRPTPDDLLNWLNDEYFKVFRKPFILEPYHFGLIITKQ